MKQKHVAIFMVFAFLFTVTSAVIATLTDVLIAINDSPTIYVYAFAVASIGGIFCGLTFKSMYFFSKSTADWLVGLSLLVLLAAMFFLYSGFMSSDAAAMGLIWATLCYGFTMFFLRKKYHAAYEQKVFGELCDHYRGLLGYETLNAEEKASVDRRLERVNTHAIIQLNAIVEHAKKTLGDDENLFELFHR
jgi:hypothetical protein